MEMADRAMARKRRAVIDGIAAFPVGAAGEPRPAALWSGRLRERQKSVDERLGVGLDAHVETVHAIEFREFGRVHVDNDLTRAAAKFLGVVRGHDVVEARADRDQEICVLNREIGRAKGDDARLADA